MTTKRVDVRPRLRGLLVAGAMLAASCMGEAGAPATAALSGLAVDDFAGGVTNVSHPAGAGSYGVWYNAKNDAFATVAAATLDGQPAMRIDDGGYTNGVYAIYGGAIPADGTYQISVPVQVVEPAGATDGIRAYQVGVAVGAAAAHRGPNPSALPGLGTTASFVGLTPGDDNGLGTQTLVTAEFDAQAGDDVLIAFGTDVSSGGWNLGAGAWGGSYVLVGAISLVGAVSDGSTIVDDDDGAPDFTQTGSWAVSGGAGYGTGHYRFASTGNASDATWHATVEPGYYDVQVQYRSGGNRASSAHYTVTSGSESFETSVNQRVRDAQWVYIGGIDATSGAVDVTLSAAKSIPLGAVVIADAVRLIPSSAPEIDDPEMRVAAVTVFDDIGDAGAIQSMVDEIAAHHYNAIAIHTRYRGDATYFPNRADSTYPNAEPRSPQAGDVDVLEEFVTRGHARGLKVFAYVNTHLVTDGSTSPTDPNHVANAHPEWRTYAYNGGSPTVQTTAEDGEGLWLDPALPEVNEYLANIAGDLAMNYEIDGLVLDRIRYPQTAFTRENRDFGYHPQAIERFNRRYRKRGVPDPRDPDWIQFRQDAITASVAAIYDRLTDIDENLVLLAYPIGRFNDALTFNYQDWPRWMSEGVIDGVLPQIYSGDAATFAASLAQHAAAYEGDRLLGVSVDGFRAGVDVANQLETARAGGFAGSSPFRHGTMGDLGYLEHLRRAWNGTAEWPATPWKGSDVLTLEVDGACSDDPSVRRWRVRNPNAWAIQVQWSTVLTGASGSFYAPPGESFFTADAPNRWPMSLLPMIALVSWENEARKPRVAAAVSFLQICR